jgi:Tol biopolymer transport system component/DNA-binding winged helix-turn-helix (wHTH) protein
MENLPEKKFLFADFELDGVRRLLSKQGTPVALKSKTFDLLLVLVENRGEILGKDELLEKVWAGQFIEDSNITVHISTLRKILGEKKDENRFIVTVPGRGYSFIAELHEEDQSESNIFFERHSLARIVVEEEIEAEGEQGSEGKREITVGSKTLAPTPLHPYAISTKLAIGFIAILALGINGYFLFRFYFKRSEIPFQQMSMKRLTSTGNIGQAVLSPDGKLFVYAIEEAERQSLWIGHIDGGEPVQIRPPANLRYLDFQFTPDGSSIYYAISENTAPPTLYKIPIFGGAPEKIQEQVRKFSFAPDGNRFTFLRSIPNESRTTLMSGNAKGGDELEIADLPKGIIREWGSPEWSSDGSTIIVAASMKVEETKIFTINTATGTIKTLTDKTWRSLTSIQWLRDGSGLIATGIANDSLVPQLWFISFPDGEVHRLSHDLNDYGYVVSLANEKTMLTVQGFSQSNIWIAPTENLKEAKQITFGSVGRQDGWFGLVWTNDERIIYTADTNDGVTLWLMNADGSKQKQLIPNGGINSYPSLTADGRSLIFQSNRTGHFAIWRADLDGGNMKQLTGDQIAAQPFVSPDGKWILYVSNIDSIGELWRIPSSGGERFQMSDKLAGWAAVSPDSKFVAAEVKMDDNLEIAILLTETGEIVKSFQLPHQANLRLGIHWTPDGKAITFRDWTNGIWKQNIDGGEPKHLEGLPEEKLFSFGWSPDGKNFTFTRGSTSRDVVLISGNQ